MATPLHNAAFQGHESVANYLIKSGANVNAIDDEGATSNSLLIIRNDSITQSSI